MKRRKLFATVAAAAITATDLEQGWVKPVVSAVILPAHAATSPLCADGSIVLPGVSGIAVGCGLQVPDSTSIVSYDIDDADICALQYTVGAETDLVPGRIIIVYNSETKSISNGESANYAFISVLGLSCELIHLLGSTGSGTQCREFAAPAPGAFDCTFTGKSGMEFTATGVLDDHLGESLFLSDIVLSVKQG